MWDFCVSGIAFSAVNDLLSIFGGHQTDPAGISHFLWMDWGGLWVAAGDGKSVNKLTKRRLNSAMFPSLVVASTRISY